jgi:tetratricopeptide (TPR) repeat protein
MAGASPVAIALSPAPPVEMTCPIDGTTFHATGTRDADTRYDYADYRRFPYGRFLDLKSSGATLAPWPIAKCPSNGFVIYKSKFTQSELSRLKRYVMSDDYQSMKDMHTNYYLAARIRAHMGDEQARLSYTLLQATWEARSRTQYAKYAAEALEAYKASLLKPYANADERIIDQLVAVELERRLGRFDRAIARIHSLIERKEAKEKIYREVLAVQLKLAKTADNRLCSLHEPYPGERASEEPKFGCHASDLPMEHKAVARPAFKGTEAEIYFQQAAAMERNGEYAEAVRNYRRAARLGYGKAARRLAEIYDKGVPGVARDLSEHMMWAQRAGELGEKVPTETRR